MNNSARAMMAAVAKYRDDLSGKLNTAGSSTAYTITSNQTFTSLSDGITIAARMHTASGTNPTLNVDSLGAKSIYSIDSTNVPSGDLQNGAIYTFTYDSGDDVWYVHGYNPGSSRDSLGLDTDDSPQFAGINLGHASDTTLTRTGAGDIAIEGNAVYRAGGTNVAIADGGTNADTAAAAFTNLKQAASDTATGVLEIAVQSEMEAASSATLAVTPGRQHFHPGHPKAGGNLDGTGTVSILSGDYGLASLTDNGTGNYTVSLDTAFANTNYWTNGIAGYTATTCAVSPDAKTTSSLQLRIRQHGVNNDIVDTDDIGISFFGDYA